MKNASMNELHESPDERMLKRRARRWKRRARIAGPLLSVPILVLTLALSVDLIEYQPQEPQEKLADRPIPEAATAGSTEGEKTAEKTSEGTAEVTSKLAETAI